MKRGTTLERISGVTADDMNVLRAANIGNAETFLARIAENPALLEVFTDGVARFRVARAVAAHALDASKKITAHRVADHVPDAVLVVALLALVGTAVAQRVVDPKQPPTVQAVEVIASAGISPFQVIGSSDIKDVTIATTNPPVSQADVVGRYSRDYFAKGSHIDRSKLSDRAIAASDLAGLRVLQVAFDADSKVLQLSPPAKIGLAAGGRAEQQAPGVVLDNVYVLHVDPQADRVVAIIATSAENVARLAPFLGTKVTPVLPEP